MLGRRLVAPALFLGLSSAATALAEWGWSDVMSWRGATPSVDTVVATAAGLVAAGVCAWLALGVLVTTAAALAGWHPQFRVLPGGLQRTVAWSVGAGILVATAVPAQAATPDPSPGRSPGGSVRAAAFDPNTFGLNPTNPIVPGPATPAPATPAPATPTPATSAPNTATATVSVVRGDTLWDIAKEHLPAKANTQQVAAEWPRWYRANRAVIGSDPDLLHPGQRLEPPTTPTTGPRSQP